MLDSPPEKVLVYKKVPSGKLSAQEKYMFIFNENTLPTQHIDLHLEFYNNIIDIYPMAFLIGLIHMNP